MRQSVVDLIEKTIGFVYDLPNNDKGIPGTIFSTTNDKCYCATDKEAIADIIYNALIEYSHKEFDWDQYSLDNLHQKALRTKLKYNPDDSADVKLKYGFFGEILLFSILIAIFKTKPAIARGYFYNPLENSETKGYDSYHLIEADGNIELWFGEVKFHGSHISGIKSALNNIDKALSDIYFEKNVLAMYNHINDFNVPGSKIQAILSQWDDDPNVKIIDEIRKHGMRLMYPILLLYDHDDQDYDSNIKKICDHIMEKYTAPSFSLTIDYHVFFILLPLKEIQNIKKTVIKWIESNKPLMS